jgi:cytochrome c556
MRLAVKIMGVAAMTVIAGITLLPMGPTDAASGEQAIKARIDFMKGDLYDHWKVLAAYGKKGKGSLADVEKSANALAKISKKIPEYFPKDTGRGKYPDKMTRSLPVIWKDSEGFKKDIQRLADQSEKLARLAKEGNKDAVVTLIGTSGKYSKTKIGCAECHKTFRGAKVKK